MGNNDNCDLKSMEKLCNPEEAKLLWDEYKYRHDLIWKHLIRSTIAVIILITVPYSTKIVSDKYLVWGASVAAFIYLCHTFWVIYRENKLIEKEKVLHRKRQMHYLDEVPTKCFTWDNELKGNFLSRIIGYLFLLLMLVIYAVLIINYSKVNTGLHSGKANKSLNRLSNSEITISDLIQSKMTLDELISRLKKDADEHNQGKKISESSEQSKEIEDLCSKLEFFLSQNIEPIKFKTGYKKIGDKQHNALEKLAKYLVRAENSKVCIIIEGHTDSTYSDITNISLGINRAEAVETILDNFGVKKERIFVASYGEQIEKVRGGDDNKNEWSRIALIKAARTFKGQCLLLN